MLIELQGVTSIHTHKTIGGVDIYITYEVVSPIDNCDILKEDVVLVKCTSEDQITILKE